MGTSIRVDFQSDLSRWEIPEAPTDRSTWTHVSTGQFDSRKGLGRFWIGTTEKAHEVYFGSAAEVTRLGQIDERQVNKQPVICPTFGSVEWVSQFDLKDDSEAGRQAFADLLGTCFVDFHENTFGIKRTRRGEEYDCSFYPRIIKPMAALLKPQVIGANGDDPHWVFAKLQEALRGPEADTRGDDWVPGPASLVTESVRVGRLNIGAASFEIDAHPLSRDLANQLAKAEKLDAQLKQVRREKAKIQETSETLSARVTQVEKRNEELERSLAEARKAAQTAPAPPSTAKAELPAGISRTTVALVAALALVAFASGVAFANRATLLRRLTPSQ